MSFSVDRVPPDSNSLQRSYAPFRGEGEGASSEESSFDLNLENSSGQMGALLDPYSSDEAPANDTPSSAILAVIQKSLRNQKRLYKYYTGPDAIHAQVQEGQHGTHGVLPKPDDLNPENMGRNKKIYTI